MNVLLAYRGQVFIKEIKSQLNKFKNANVYLVTMNIIDAKIIPLMIKHSNLDHDTHINILSVKELLEGKLDHMKFNHIVGNPPYQIQVGDSDNTKPIWDKIIVKCFDLLEPNGTMTMIHPSGWRFATEKSKGAVQEVKDIYYNNEVTYAEFNDLNKGREVFGAGTDYDVMTVVKNGNPKPVLVNTKTEDITINFGDFGVIPTDKISLFRSLIAKKGEEKVELFNDYKYGSDDRFPYVNDIETDEFKYPVVYGFPLKEGLKLMYSNTTSKGHFGITKLIITKASQTAMLDLDGKYGMTQFASGYVDIPENLVKIKKVMETPFFKNLKGDLCGTHTNKNAIIDNNGIMFKFIKEFRKDWWKDLYTPEMEQELINEGVLDNDGNYIG
jgi:hypothetical protein